ncbi:hypothetical protein Q3G72_008684 [Acer saccharum]|nr:hypothetical protein Q3G72_008684 [Acer saccharum]
MGQQFLSLDEAREFYNAYAKEAGFSVRINSSKRSRDNSEILRKEYVCSKEGTTSTRVNSKRKRRRGLTREGCNAKFTVVKSKSGGYVVKQFVEGHTHSLTSPQRAHLLRLHRSEANKSLSQQLSTVNILEVQTRGIQDIGCIEKDVYNHERNLCSEMRGHDEELLYEYFLSEQEKNASFIYDIKKDEEDRITHCFWADAKSRRAYNFFGDVVVFDTTYDTNRYGMVFATFIGVNNHCQSVIFGCSFLSDETTESFMWSFEQFKKSMSGGPPKVIITDQNPTMTKAIAHTFPNTVHKYCIWHILNKFSEKLNEVVYRNHYNDFKQCIWDSYSKEEFELKWMEAIGRSMLHDNTWLQSVYEMRAKWVPVFVNHVFSAGMTNSQRVETCHGFFKRWTKTAKYERVVDDLGIEINHFSDNSFISRRTRLFQLASNVIESVAFSDKDSKIVEDGLSDLLRRFKKDKAITSCGSINDRNSTKEQVYNEPPAVQAKECGERLKDGKEKACDLTKEKGRHCNGCGKVEQDHDKRNCPTHKNQSSVDANEDSNLLDLNNGILPQ